MAEVKHAHHKTESKEVLDRAKDFWTKYNRVILITCSAIILLGGGYLGYKYFIKEPKEKKAADAIWRAQNDFEADSVKQALNEFEKIINQYSGTEQGNLARYYAGSSALKLGDNNKAVKYLKDFSTDAKQVQARAYKLLADAYANLGKNPDALNNYKKAAHEFEKDVQGSSEYLFIAAYFADRVMNDKKQAIDLYKELQKKPKSQLTDEADRYLAQAGIYKAEN